jgi:hypothetical protein
MEHLCQLLQGAKSPSVWIWVGSVKQAPNEKNPQRSMKEASSPSP